MQAPLPVGVCQNGQPVKPVVAALISPAPHKEY